MAKYIDTNKALDQICDIVIYSEEVREVKEEAIRIIADMLPADVQEVKHGKWVHDESCSFCEHRCSQCGYKWDYNGIDVQEYCPTCGAKMDL